MYLYKNTKYNYDIVHDNLNNIWLITDLSDKKYKFYYRYKLPHNNLKLKMCNFKLSIETFINLSISTLLLLLLIISLNSSTKHFADNNVYDKFYTEYPILSINRSETTNANSLQTALEDINKKEYNTALKNLQIIINDNNTENNIIAHFYTGVILQKKGDYKNSIIEYEKVINDKDNLFIEQSNWYIGLCYLRIHKKYKAIEYFNKITDNTYKSKVQEILSEIN